MAPNTPSGVSFMIISVYLNITCATPSKKRSTGSPFLPTRMSAMPKSDAKTTTGRMSPSAACFTRFDGSAWSAMSQPDFGCASVVWASNASGRPAPGFSVFAIPRPRKRAIVVTISKYRSDFAPMRPTLFRSPVCAMPVMIVATRIGTMIPLMSVMKLFERNWKNWNATG